MEYLKVTVGGKEVTGAKAVATAAVVVPSMIAVSAAVVPSMIAVSAAVVPSMIAVSAEVAAGSVMFAGAVLVASAGAAVATVAGSALGIGKRRVVHNEDGSSKYVFQNRFSTLTVTVDSGKKE